MSWKKKSAVVLLGILLILLNIGILTHPAALSDTVQLQITMKGPKDSAITAFSSTDGQFALSNSATASLTGEQKKETLTFAQASDGVVLRLDLGNAEGSFEIYSASYTYGGHTETVDLGLLTGEGANNLHDISRAELTGEGYVSITADGSDPYIVTEVGAGELQKIIAPVRAKENRIKTILYAAVLDAVALLLFLLRKKFATLPVELIENRKLIFNLARNDFKTRYAGSVLGIIWAFVQPAVTVLVYWFVFEKGLGSGPVEASDGTTYPFVLWLIAGLVPWFFFQDTMVSATNALIEYSYLVKKMVFKISILPLVKEISAIFVHLFFIGLMLVLYILSGFFPDLYWLQVIYYTGALFIYALGVSYLTCSVNIFFRDLTQIINIVIQVQVWLTPIMWNIDTTGARLPGWARSALKLNPLYYIVSGYRDAMMNKVWFFDRFDMTFYYWVVTALVFGIGTFVFKRLKVHFADIL